MNPKATVVMPVFNRVSELRRALDSLAAQSMSDFECLVVDDNSTIAIQPVVDAYDSRFVYLKSERNVGPSAARLLGFKRMSGDFMFQLDSDNYVYPWALERALHLLESHPTASGVSGLFVFPEGLRVRVKGGSRLLTPADYAMGQRSPYDMVGAVRREVIDEWLDKSHNYFSAEFHLWFTYHMHRNHLAVDEPWGTYSEGTGPRVTRSSDERKFLDLQQFVDEHRQKYETVACLPLDEYLSDNWVRLRRAGRAESRLVEDWMRVRGVSRRTAVTRRVMGRLIHKQREHFVL